jgi:hypothetical protein
MKARQLRRRMLLKVMNSKMQRTLGRKMTESPLMIRMMLMMMLKRLTISPLLLLPLPRWRSRNLHL